MSHNHVTIYSNGIADFCKNVTVKSTEPTALSIPVRKQDLGDLLGTFQLFGDVTLQQPPSFSPQNVSSGNLTLNSGDVLEQMVQSLSGSAIEVKRPEGTLKGHLLGLHKEQQGTSGDPIRCKFLVMQTETGITKISFKDILSFNFTEEVVQKEIEKALKRNREQLKPGSAFVDVIISTDQPETEATIQYALPAAAWKITYRLYKQEDGKYEFQGFAIVDNNTDEDWNDVLISVVTGEPITFSTDLALSKIPERSHVNVVADIAVGAVELEKAIFGSVFEHHDDEVEMNAASADMMMASAPMAMRRSARKMKKSAEMPSAETTDVGDFNIFHATTPITIASQRSAAVPVFQTTIDDAKVVLHYEEQNHATRPYRCVEFINQTEFSLGRGVCAVYDTGTYGGSCILPATKPIGNALLAHALETGLKISREYHQQHQTNIGLFISKGVCVTKQHVEQKSSYHISNLVDKEYQLVLDHHHQLHESQLNCTFKNSVGEIKSLEIDSKLADGVRLRLDVAANESGTIQVTEASIEQSSVTLLNLHVDDPKLNIHWLQQNVIQQNGPLEHHAGIQECIAIQEKLDDKQESIQCLIAETNKMESRQERLRQNIIASGESEQSTKWRADLMTSEERIVAWEEHLLPKLQLEADEIKQELRTAIKKLTAEWSAVSDSMAMDI